MAHTAAMLDLETLGTSVRSVVLEIAVVKFDLFTGELLDRIHLRRMDVDAQTARGRVIDQDTLLWWMKQSEEARAVVFDPALPRNDPEGQMWSLNKWMRDARLQGGLWSKGPSFDVAILESLCRTYRIPGLGVKFWEVRDLRTILALANLGGASWDHLNPPREKSVAHSALDDVLYQIQQLTAAMRALGLAGQAPTA